MNGILARLRDGLRDESGQALVVGVVSLIAVLPCVGLAIDVGQIRYEQQQMQSAVDAAALAGAIEIGNCGGTANCAALQTAAQQALKENGITGSKLKTQCASVTNALTLTVNNGPCALGSTDPNNGNTSYVEAVLSGPVSTIFANMIGIRTIEITVRAEARESATNSQYCLYTGASNTSSSGPWGITLNSGGIIDAECGIYDDSGSANALESNSGATVDSTIFVVHGGWSPNNGGTFSAQPETGAPAVADPLSNLTPPTPAGSCTNLSPNSSTTISQGTYCGLNVNSGVTITLNPGTYIFEGGVNVNNGASLVGTGGVTLYMTNSAQLNLNTGSTVQLVAPTTGSLAGVVIWQASGDDSEINIDSNANGEYQGAIYAPTAQLTLNSGGNTAAYTIVDVQQLMVDAGANFKLNNDYSSLPDGSPIKSSGGGAALAE